MAYLALGRKCEPVAGVKFSERSSGSSRVFCFLRCGVASGEVLTFIQNNANLGIYDRAKNECHIFISEKRENTAIYLCEL